MPEQNKITPLLPEQTNAGPGISELLKANLNLANLNNRLNHIFNTLDNSFWGVDMVDFKMLYASPANEKIYGYSNDDFFANPGLWYQVIVPEDKKIGKNVMREIAKGQPYIAEYRIRHKDGSIRWIEVRLTPTLNEEGKLILVDGITIDITERKKAISKILKSEDQFKSLVENISGVYWVNNLETYQTLYISPSYETIWGRSCEELYKDPAAFINAVHPDDRTILLEAHKNIAEYKQVNINYRIIRPDGEIRWIAAKTNIKVDDGNKIEYGYAEDITERKKAEDSRSQSESHLRAILDAEPDCVKLVNLKGELIEMNAAGLEMVEAENMDQVRGARMVNIVTEPYKKEYLEFTAKVFTGWSGTLEFEIIGLKGRRLWLETKAVPFRDQSGNIVALLGITRDITARNLTKKILKENEQRLLEAQQMARIGDYTFDFATGIWNCSLALDEITGLDSEAIMQFDRWVALIAPEYRESVMGTASLFFEKGIVVPGHYLDCKIFRANDGAERWVSIVGEVEHDEQGKPLTLRGTVQDITERKKAEEEIKKLNESLEQKVEERTKELKQLNLELEAFNHTVSHDLQNPLRTLAGFSKLLLNDYSDKLDAEGKEYLETIESSAKRMSTLVRDLMNFSKLGKVAVAKVNVDMTKVAQDVIREIKPHYKNLNTEVVLHDLQPAFCDAGLIRQVWDNLIGNAIKYSSKTENPLVEIGMREINGESAYYVRDNGAGFDMKDADKLFKVFERLHSKHEYDGTGVGLSIVERIIAKQGGRIWAEGKIDEGAAFYFTLPSKKP